MIIPIHLKPESSSGQGTLFPLQLASFGTEELILLELQGEFIIEGDRSGQLAATLRLGDNNAKPTLIIGHHHLEGKIVELNKPIAVTKKRISECEADAGGQKQCEYDVVAVVQRKLLFSKRPMPVMNIMTRSLGSDVKGSS